MKDGKHPNPNTIHPIAGYDKEIYVKPTISLPRHIENGIVPDGFHLTAMPLLFVSAGFKPFPSPSPVSPSSALISIIRPPSCS